MIFVELASILRAEIIPPVTLSLYRRETQCVPWVGDFAECKSDWLFGKITSIVFPLIAEVYSMTGRFWKTRA